MKVTVILILFLLFVSSVLFVKQKMSFQQWLESGHLKIKSAASQKASVDPQTLPPLLQNYLETVIVQPSTADFVEFSQAGDFRMNPEDEMSRFTADQVVSLQNPMFSWVAQIPMKGLPITVCDRLVAGQGELQARLFSTIPLARGSGDSFLRGELLRYLAELPWYPMAILEQPNILWQQTAPNKVKGTLQVKSVVATVEYTFDQTGTIQSIYVPDRDRSDGKTSETLPWLGEFSQYEERAGTVIPIQGQVSWLLDSGKFTYFVGKISTYTLGRTEQVR
jgi:hypothetical protein